MKPHAPSARRSARRRLPALPALLLLAAAAGVPPLAAAPAALAQPGATPADQPQPPFAGEVSVDRVEVRSGAGESYYPVAVFERGQRVRVVEDFYGWYRIEAPEGLRAYVAQRDLDRRGDGSVGVANADAARVKIKGLDRGYDDSFRTITFLNPGDRVQIVDAVGNDAYEVLAPEGSLVFLPPGSVTPLASLADEPSPAATPAPPATPEPAPAAGSNEAAGGEMVPLGDAPAPEPRVAPTPPSREQPAATPGPEPALADALARVEPPAELPPIDLGDGGLQSDGPAADDGPLTPAAPAVETSDAVAAVEEAQLPRFALPLEQQPLEEMEAAYRELAESGTLRPFEERLVRSRLSAVQRNRQLMAAVAQIEARRAGLVDVAPTAIEPEPAEPFAAVGVLRTSSVFGGEEAGVAMPKMFRVIDPATERTIAYLRPARGVDPVPLLGQLVGVRGSREIDSTLNTPLVTAQDVVALNPAAE